MERYRHVDTDKRMTVYPELSEKPYSVLDYYKALYDPSLRELPELYCSAPISSANFGQLIPSIQGRDLPFPFRQIYLASIKQFPRLGNDVPYQRIFSLNGRLNRLQAQLIRDEEFENGHVLTLPQMIGPQSDFRESDFMTFWMMRMVRMSPQQAGIFYNSTQKADIDYETFNAHGVDKISRFQEYMKLLLVFENHIKKHPVTDKFESVLALTGFEKSLGCVTEINAALSAGIPVLKPEYNSLHPEFKKTLAFHSYGTRWLRQHNIPFTVNTFEGAPADGLVRLVSIEEEVDLQVA